MESFCCSDGECKLPPVLLLQKLGLVCLLPINFPFFLLHPVGHRGFAEPFGATFPLQV